MHLGSNTYLRTLTATMHRNRHQRRHIMTLKYFLGIDESNHGKFPEIYIAALTDDPLAAEDHVQNPDSERPKGLIGKMRNSTASLDNMNLKDMLMKEWAFLVLDKKDLSYYSEHELAKNSHEAHELLKIDATMTLVQHMYSKMQKLNNERLEVEIFVDGMPPKKIISAVEDYTKDFLPEHISAARIGFYQDGDRRFRIVNEADLKAVIIYRALVNKKLSIEEVLKSVGAERLVQLRRFNALSRADEELIAS